VKLDPNLWKTVIFLRPGSTAFTIAFWTGGFVVRIAWDNDNAFWDAQLVSEDGDTWLTLSEVPMAKGTIVTITPLGNASGPHFEFTALVVEQGEDILVSAYSERRFWNRLRPINVDLETSRQMLAFNKAA
jgi:hypothetical protein